MNRDKYGAHVQMYARMCLAAMRNESRLSVNYGFIGGDDESVRACAEALNISVEELVDRADAYLAGGCGMSG